MQQNHVERAHAARRLAGKGSDVLQRLLPLIVRRVRIHPPDLRAVAVDDRQLALVIRQRLDRFGRAEVVAGRQAAVAGVVAISRAHRHHVHHGGRVPDGREHQPRAAGDIHLFPQRQAEAGHQPGYAVLLLVVGVAVAKAVLGCRGRVREPRHKPIPRHPGAAKGQRVLLRDFRHGRHAAIHRHRRCVQVGHFKCRGSISP